MCGRCVCARNDNDPNFISVRMWPANAALPACDDTQAARADLDKLTSERASAGSQWNASRAHSGDSSGRLLVHLSAAAAALLLICIRAISHSLARSLTNSSADPIDLDRSARETDSMGRRANIGSGSERARARAREQNAPR